MDNEIDGESLVPLIEKESNISNPIYMETASVDKEELLGKAVGIRTPDYKYFRSRKSPKERVHLYDLKNDPNEEKNLANDDLETVKNMELILTNFLANANVEQQPVSDSEERDMIEYELKKLGYIN